MPRALQHALVVLSGLLLVAVSSPQAQASTHARRAEESTSLTVAITSLTPGAIPRKGPVTVSGTVTNTDTEAWTNVRIYPFVGGTAITTTEGLADAMDQASDAEVGARITTVGDYATVASLPPGQTVPYTLTVPRADLDAKGVGAPGVYWFGVHALGTGPDGNDDLVADGRARTFLPLLPKNATQVDSAVIVPIRATVTRTSSGALEDVDRWSDLLEPDGRLGRLLSLATTPAGRDVSWLVDPAVLAAVQQLGAGNPDRPLAAPADEEGSDDNSSEDPNADDGDTPDEATQRAATLAAEWWTRMSSALQGADVLALPYGDLDLTGAGLHDSAAYDTARKRSEDAFAGWGISATPVNAPLAGVLDEEAARLLRTHAADTPVLISSQLLPEGTSATRVRSADLDLVPVDAIVGAGGPGPDDPLAGVALRQRVLAEAALRSLDATAAPVVVQLPTRWAASDAEQLALGLRQPWLVPHRLGTTVAEAPVTPVDFDHLRIPTGTTAKALGSRTFESANALIRLGRTLQRVLTGNEAVAEATLDEGLADLSYQRRSARTDAAAASAMSIASLLGHIRVQAPRSVTLSGSSGRFAATITNDLEQPVTVILKPLTDAGLSLSTPKPIDVGAGASATVLMQATGARAGVHNVQLTLTDKRGARFGSSVAVPVRAAQVSKIIWLFLAVGCGLLFAAIAVRLIRRVRRSRREQA